MSNEIKNVPQLRFPEFTNPWEKRKLDELATMNARIGWQNLRTSEYLDSGKYMLITGTDFKDGGVDYSTVHYVDQTRYDQDKKIQIKNKNILITKDGALGKVAYVQNLKMPATLNAGVFNVQVKDDDVVDSQYLFHYLKAPFLLKYATKNSAGGTIKHLNQKILVSFPIPLPEKKEQVKIGEFFKQLDDFIAVNQREGAKLIELKKAYLEKMFPKNGESEPELRFQGFTSPWEKRKLSDVADRFDNLRIPITASDRIAGDTPYYGANGIQDYVEGFTHEGEFILVAEDGANDLKNYPVHYVNGKVWVNNHTHVLQGKKTITNNKFLMNSIKNFNIELFLVGGGRAKLNADAMMKLNILLPSFKEQEKIGSFFKQLDNTITANQREGENLQKLKKAYLKDTFV